uniref:Receptor expression-enhancing protein n=1 Tax=Corethron hystrix TaxID=216773 RepID=A0A7S1B7Y3_9STRA|mmetsp:Transcript_16580/g.37257  ORF Transcript_16580/g.37257 Transcript_16580/m.37257 type:complete len:174 (+) Transcript_16580:174-695(+)
MSEDIPKPIHVTAMETLNAALTNVDTLMEKHPSVFQYEKFKKLENKTGYSKVFFLFGAVVAGTLFLIAMGGTQFISDLIGFVYPAYCSFKAIDSANTEEDVQWLTYWVVFASFSIIESAASFLVSWIPFYFFIKLSFLIWLYHPTFLGAQLVYKQVLRPLIIPYMASMQKKVS